jgi:hypothetical protein
MELLEHDISEVQIERIAQRIEALARPTQQGGPHPGVVFQMPGQTIEEARRAHAGRYPEDDVGTMMVIGWQPMTAAEWIAKYGASTAQD